MYRVGFFFLDLSCFLFISQLSNLVSLFLFLVQDITEAKISVFSDIDSPVPPSGKGMSEFYRGITAEMRQRRREELLRTERKDILKAAQMYLAQIKVFISPLISRSPLSSPLTPYHRALGPDELQYTQCGALSNIYSYSLSSPFSLKPLRYSNIYILPLCLSPLLPLPHPRSNDGYTRATLPPILLVLFSFLLFSFLLFSLLFFCLSSPPSLLLLSLLSSLSPLLPLSSSSSPSSLSLY